jgi:hypothetical protein
VTALFFSGGLAFLYQLWAAHITGGYFPIDRQTSIQSSGVLTANDSPSSRHFTNIPNADLSKAGLALKTASLPPSMRDDLLTLEKGIVAEGVSQESVDTLKKLIYGMLDEADPQIVANLAKADIHFIIIPRNKKMTDLPYFASLKGTKTRDGRSWDDTRGHGDFPMAGGGKALGVPEEGLSSEPDTTYSYPKSFVFMHEFGHMVHDHGLSGEMREELEHFYDTAMRLHGTTGLGSYADTDENEYFAQATATHFGNGCPVEAMKDLSKTDPELDSWLGKVYGPARKLEP